MSGRDVVWNVLAVVFTPVILLMFVAWLFLRPSPSFKATDRP